MRILLVKLSSLGDVVHTLPVVQDILAARPGAQIDWVVERSFAPLLSPLRARGHLQHVIPCELRRWRKAPLASATRAEWGAFKKQLQAQPYDAVIDLQGLTKSALVARLARLAPGGKRYALANQTEGSAYEAPTRWVADVAIAMAPHIHAMQRGRELCARALGYALPPVPDFGLKVPPAHMERAQDAPETIAFGEWCFAEHSVFYDSLPDWFLLFDVYDRRQGRFWSRVRRDELARNAGLWTAPLVASGVLSLPALKRLPVTSRLGRMPAEGVCLRWDDGDWLVARAKVVRPGWVMGSDEHWSSGALKTNRLRDDQDSSMGSASRSGSRA